MESSGDGCSLESSTDNQPSRRCGQFPAGNGYYSHRAYPPRITIHARPELAVQIAEQEFPTLPKPIVQAAVARMAAADVYPQDPSISTQAFANALALQVFVGNVKSGQVSYADSVDNQFALAAGKAEANK